MSDKEAKAFYAIAEAFPKLSEFQKGYFLGVAETMTEKGIAGDALSKNDKDNGGDSYAKRG